MFGSQRLEGLAVLGFEAVEVLADLREGFSVKWVLFKEIEDDENELLREKIEEVGYGGASFGFELLEHGFEL